MKKATFFIGLVTGVAVIFLQLLIISPVSGQSNVQTPDPTVSWLPGCAPQSVQIYSNLDVVKAGEDVEFEIRSEDGDMAPGEFIWDVSVGTFLSGQGSNRIVVSMPENILESVKSEILAPEKGFILTLSRPSFPLKVAATSISQAGCANISLAKSIRISTHSAAVNIPVNVTELNLEKSEVNFACEGGNYDAVIDITVKAFDPEDDVLSYSYIVTARKIIGDGAKVKWDLSDVLSGSYSITAAADDGCGKCGKTITKTVTVSRCN